MRSQARPRHCLICGDSMTIAETGRPRKYCSVRCKSRAAVARRTEEQWHRYYKWQREWRKRTNAPSKWYWQDRERRLAYGRAYRRANREELARKDRQRRAQWRERNPDAWRLQVQRTNRARDARLRGAGGRVAARDWARLLVRYRGCCAYCGERATTQDHVIPLSRGGRHTIGNVLPACQSCNSSKHDRLLMEWKTVR
jgi:5-methylcytosine-specific restriction endonuclease McrA